MEINEILTAFEPHDRVYKREAVDAALAHQAEITPHLLQIIERVLADPETYADDLERMEYIYAFILLGHFRETRAHEMLIELFSLPEKTIDPLFGDLITEDLPIVLYRTCGGSLEAIKSLALNRDAYEFCRSSALRALTLAVLDGLVDRQTMLDFYGSLFKGDEAEPGSLFWSFVAVEIDKLYPESLMDVIKQAYQDGLIQRSFIGLPSFERTLAEGLEATLAESRDWGRLDAIDDVHAYMSWWAMFDQPKEKGQATNLLGGRAATANSPQQSQPNLSPLPKSSRSGSAKARQEKKKQKKKRKQAKAARKRNRKRK